MFKSPLSARERLLIYGEPATGKTNAYLSIAKLNKLTKTQSMMYVIDNDRSVLRMIEGQGLDNYVTVAEVYDWPEYLDAEKAFLKAVRPDDWLVADLMSETWTAVQSFYSEQVFGSDIGSYFLQLKKEMHDGNEFGGWTDWKYINKLYFDFARPFVYKSPCHVIGVSTADAVSAKLDDKETLSVFSKVGFRPEGQKRLKHQFNTTVFMHKSRTGEYLYTTVKDRERELQVSASLGTDGGPKLFAMEYLKKVAGWAISPKE